MDGHDHFIAPEERADLLGEVVQRVAVLRKNNQLFAIAVGVLHQIIVLQNGGKFIPFPVCSAGANLIRHGFQIAKNINFRLQFRNGCGGGRLIGNRFFLFFQFVCRKIIHIILILGNAELPGHIRGALAKLFFRQARFQAFATAMKRLVDRLRRGCKAALKYGQCKADGGAMGTVQMIGAIEFLLHIGGDGGIQLRFHGGEVIIDGIGNALRE